MAATYAIGMDLGGTNARAAAVDEGGRILAVHKHVLTARTPEAAARALADCAAAVRALVRPEQGACTGYGVGIAGQVDAKTGLVIVAPNLGWRDSDFGALLAARLGAPVALANDLAVATLGEARAGAARGFADALLVFVGSGIGSGLVFGGRSYRGARGVGGELGHVKVAPGGRLCGCGERGCLEAYAGGHGLARRASEAIAAGRASTLSQLPGGGEVVTTMLLEQHAEAGDALSQELRGEAAVLVGVATANLVTMLDPSVLILGGGVVQGSPYLRRRIEEVVRDNASLASLTDLLIVDPALGDDAGVIGAAFLARERAPLG